MKKGFTLVELLAVIVILSIIVLIVTPVVLSVIDDSEKTSIKVSAEHYIDAVNAELSNQEMIGEYEILDGVYEISNKGKVLTNNKNTIIYLDYKGKAIEEGFIIVNRGLVKQIVNGKIDDWYVKISSGEVKLSEKLNTLLTGKEFNAAIKTLASGTNKLYTDSDSTINKIEFYDYGKLPEGYTKGELETLDNIDVSETQDKSIMAYYDVNGNMYIYSDGSIQGNQDSVAMFYYLSSLKQINVDNLDMSNVTNIANIFRECNSLVTLDLSNWTTANMTNISVAFGNSENLLTVDLSNWDTSKVTDMSYMFSTKASDIDTENVYMNIENIIGIEDFDTSNVTTMNTMFQNCNKLKNIDLSNWDTTNVIDMSWMFNRCESLNSLDLSNWNTNNVTNMNNMFKEATNLKCIKVGSNWTIENATTEYMFWSAGVSNTTTGYCKAN